MIPAIEGAKDRLTTDNPFDDAELVIYTSDTEYAKEQPTHENLQELELVSFSLWARWDSDGVEIPILGEASWHMWYSLSQEVFQPDPAEPVSDAFIASMAEWGTAGTDTDSPITRENWENMKDVEQYILHLTIEAAVSMDNPEPNLIIDWCIQQSKGDEE